ncbi:hypothetical protein NBRC111894_3934 [Sporolactobacillus inulinus]|uniref:Uncharacterized protein n=1 Tax=Sporolactobacillus inulinus TaxID=2078 RepID=A0A4Y1ZHC6_9BACL|nr:hypothetical protein NBRC111894_3934 [Sporolactobacillus inulinus]
MHTTSYLHAVYEEYMRRRWSSMTSRLLFSRKGKRAATSHIVFFIAS